MIKNQYYVYGQKDVAVPAKLHLGDFMLDRIWASRHKAAFINGATDEVLTYREIAQESMNIAVSLRHHGVKKGEVVAIFSENRREYWGVVVGVLCAGAVISTVNPGYIQGELIHVLGIAKPKTVFCSPQLYKKHAKTLKKLGFVEKIFLFGDEKLDGALLHKDLITPVSKELNNGPVIVDNRLARNVIYEEFEVVDVKGQTDAAIIMYSSGTTGLPKGVILTHLNVIVVGNYPASLNKDHSTLSITPWYHTMGLNAGLNSMAVGRTVVYLPKFDVDLYLKTIEKYKIDQLLLVPPVLVAVSKVRSKYDLSSVKLVYSGAAPLLKDTTDNIRNIFPNVEKPVLQGYGMTETTLGITKYTYDDPECKSGSVGKVNPGYIVKIVDPVTRKLLGPNQPGEICAKGLSIMKGYIGRDNREYFDEDGFFKTGDIGYYDEDRHFFIVDRLKELIKYKAYQVAPAELEALLLTHEAVKDVGVVGLPHKEAGEVPLAFVVRQPGSAVTEVELQQFVAERVSNPKHLRGGVRFVDTIPKISSGKILRNELRKMLNKSKL